ncbi:RAD50-interacting protein 1 isoform X1 [Monomorium pharaonis]|uniref:RAD50-interacting protein 1 isoform X1 n=1 Tax=Monomorium pharaonis TaxID=307658 RepID=UPI0017465B08|nr:RAD50-interacting protein 1 isoform X1 [Monomorium pharaonis]XP_036144908.1 RAD50-interacting protein 1 isoform X1 [Monomorium pharaonis]XP_036144909.1 RAD50-interacting protein 1 isoform X1 [Monomorium pharaonis]
MDIKQKIIHKFNEQLGSNLKNLEGMYNFQDCLKTEKDEIEKSLSMASTTTPSKVKMVIENAEYVNCEVEQLQGICLALSNRIEKTFDKNDKNLELQDVINKIGQLDKSLFYIYFVRYIENMSDEIETSLLFGDDRSMITLYMSLTNISYQLQTSVCHHLVNYVHETMHFWHNLIKERLSKEYNDLLKTLKWPFCGTNATLLSTPLPEIMTRFKTLVEYLFHLQLPEKMIKPVVTSALLTDFAPVSLPIALLVRPLRQRFIYHFTGAKLTNRQDKPEWFFTQILTWIKDHVQWIQKNIQPIVNSIGFEHLDIKVEFMRALVELAVEKLYSELSIVQYDDTLLAHLVDEALGFERELRETLLYPQTQPATIFVLTQAHIFVKWINMEKKYATEKMDAILSSNTAWERLMGPDIDDMKVTECADAFLTLLITISDRYKYLPQPGHRLQFLELQLELVDDWRVRLLQLLHENYEDPLTSLMPYILNTLHYVASVLEEWGTTVHFLQLHFFKKQFKAIENATDKGNDVSENIGEIEGTVFDEAVVLLQRLEKELINEISDSVALDIKAKSRAYRTDKWFAMQPSKEVSSLSVTPSGCSMFQELAMRLHMLHNVLALPLFNQAWKSLAAQLDQFLFEEVVLVNHFNRGGAEQLQYDILRNLFPLFSLYINKPESYFPLIKEACILLNVLMGSAILLKEMLHNNQSASEEILADVGVHKMSAKLALKVIATRTDIIHI